MLTMAFRGSRWIGALGLLGLLLAAFPGRVDSGPRLVEPTKTGLHLVKIEDDGLTAKFSGSTWVAGTFSARWIEGSDEPVAGSGETARDYAEILLTPTAEAAKRLPHFARYSVTQISVANEKESLEKVFGAAAALRFTRKEVHSLRAKGRFLIGDYEVGVECDAPWASARILRAEVPGKRLAGADDDGGC